MAQQQEYGHYGGTPNVIGQTTVSKYIPVTLLPTTLKNIKPQLIRTDPSTASTVLRSELTDLNGSLSKLLFKQFKSDATLYMQNNLQYGKNKSGETVKGWVPITVPMLDIPTWVETAYFGCFKSFSANPPDIHSVAEVVTFVTTHYRLQTAPKTA